jgi:hypothetical protein
LLPGNELKLLGHYDDCEWLKVETATGQIGWVRGGVGYVDVPVACSQIPDGTFRPLNNTILYNQLGKNGAGSLQLHNTKFEDSLVVVCNEANQPLYSVYIWLQESHLVTRIPNGSYRLYFHSGLDWNGNTLRFTTSGEYKKLENMLAFTTVGNNRTIWDIYTSIGFAGTNRMIDIEEDAFPRVGDQ